MEQRNQLLGLDVSTGNVWSLVKIASKTTQRQIASHRWLTVLLGNDVIDGKRVERIVVLMDVTILAPIQRTLPYQRSQYLIHERHSTWPAGRGPWISGWK